MISGVDAAPGPLALGAADRSRLFARLERALQAARRHPSGAVLAGLTVPVDSTLDPSAVVAAARRRGEPWFCFEQPERAGSALAGLGSVREIGGEGAGRFLEVAATWRDVASRAISGTGEDAHVRGSGLVAVGGFAFAPEGARATQWSAYGAGDLVVPEVTLVRGGGEVRMTVAALMTPDDLPDDVLTRVQARLADMRAACMPLLDPAPTGSFAIRSAMAPEHYESAVARAVERIRAGDLAKVVLAREVQVQAPAPHDPAAIFGVLRDAFPGCYVYCVGRGEAAFLGATPELLARRDGQRATTVALAGSTGRSADPAVDDHLGERLLHSGKDREEQAIVARRIVAALRPLSVWVAASPEPSLVRVANIQHLATPIRAQLTEPVSAVELAGLLHPTPAVGGEPWARARGLIPALEGLDRGWYAGPVGWTDATEDGEFCVALRCALLRGSTAHCYAGVGVVRDSDPASELAETEIKLQALVPILSG